MNQFLKELSRRNVIRVAIAYAIVAWLLIEVTATTFPILKLPDWSVTLVTAFVLIGFPLALIFAWAFEITPEGVKLEKHVDRPRSITQQTGRKLDFAMIGFLAIALTYFMFTHDWSNDDAGDIRSIAVLPFVNMSDDPDNEYFSDAISEELLNLLARIPELRVISRTSAFAFKGQDISIPDLARKLNVTHILEGSVRKSGNKVRITAQLIEAHSDAHLWSETYDRTLENIFAVQDEIATEVVTQLKVTLLGDITKAQTVDPDAYALYLQARHLIRLATEDSLEQSQMLLQQALETDPNYTAALYLSGELLRELANRGLRPIDEAMSMARETITRVLAIDANYAPAHGGLGYIALYYDDDLIRAARHLQRALQLDSGNTSNILKAALLVASLNRVDNAIIILEFVATRDPVNQSVFNRLGYFYRQAGRLEDSIAVLNTSLTLDPGNDWAKLNIALTLLVKGEAQAALENWQQVESDFLRALGSPMIYHSMGQTAESDAALTALIDQYADFASYLIAATYAWRNEADLAFHWLSKAVEEHNFGLPSIVYDRLFFNIHDDPRWLPFLESIGKSPAQLAAIEFKVTLPE